MFLLLHEQLQFKMGDVKSLITLLTLLYTIIVMFQIIQIFHTFSLVMFIICWPSPHWFHNTVQNFFYSNNCWQNITAGRFTLINTWTLMRLTDTAWLKGLFWRETAYLEQDNHALFQCFGCCALIHAVNVIPFQLSGTHCVFWHKMTQLHILFLNGMRYCNKVGSVCVWSALHLC